MREHAAWPALPYEEWAPTKKTLQLCAQMLGKTRLALAPPQPEWLHSCLYLDARGFTTGPMPSDTRVVTMGIDIFSSNMWIHVSDGHQATITLSSERCIADIWAEFRVALAALLIPADLWDKPQEVADTTHFSENKQECTFVLEHAQRFHRILGSLNHVFEEFRSEFFGRSSIQFWWGGCDFAVLPFNGKHSIAPDDRGYIMRYDLDAEHMNAGFWPGDDNAPNPGFYGYLVPRPDGCETAPIEPEHAGWVESMGEWMMPYDKVRESDDPHQAILDFLGSVYRIATTQGGWDAEQFTYTKPPAPPRG
jgi:hypothetical protein